VVFFVNNSTATAVARIMVVANAAKMNSGIVGVGLVVGDLVLAFLQ
jgi:hypothetical protein